MNEENLQDTFSPNEDEMRAPESEQALSALELEPEARTALIESMIFGHGEPVSAETLSSITKLSVDEIRNIVSEIQGRCREAGLGFELVEVASKFQFRTRPEFSEYVRQLKASKPRKLSHQALETLAIIAYRQPVVKSDIEKLRGVEVSPVLQTLLAKDLVKIVGHQASVGTPALYGTTEEFLKIFGLRSLDELPTLRDLKELEDPGEMPAEISGEVERLDTADSTAAPHSSEPIGQPQVEERADTTTLGA